MSRHDLGELIAPLAAYIAGLAVLALLVVRSPAAALAVLALLACRRIAAAVADLLFDGVAPFVWPDEVPR